MDKRAADRRLRGGNGQDGAKLKQPDPTNLDQTKRPLQKLLGAESLTFNETCA